MQNQSKQPLIEPLRLTDLLRSAGILQSGEVSSVETADSGAFNSSTHFLSLRYRGDVPDQAPRHLVLKQNTPEAWSMAAGVDEVNFYRLVNSLGDHPTVLPRCFAAKVDPFTGNSLLLLEDLSASHAPPITPASKSVWWKEYPGEQIRKRQSTPLQNFMVIGGTGRNWSTGASKLATGRAARNASNYT